MESCLCCGENREGLPFRALEIHTLHIRDIGGERRVQSLGAFRDWTICRECAEKKLATWRHPRIFRDCLPFLGVLILGITLCAAFWSSDAPLRLMGAAGVVCGVVGTAGTVKRRLARKRASEENLDALASAAWAALLDAAPKKSGDHDLTYLPVNARTIRMNATELAASFALLPALAEKAYHMIRES